MSNLKLEYTDFAGESHKVASGKVEKIILENERVWVMMKTELWWRQIEVKNVETVINWGQSSGKLKNYDEEIYE